MVFKVKKDLCIGCGMCVDMCPEVFNYDDSGMSESTNCDVQSGSVQEKAKDAMESCPVDAIYFE